MTEKKSDSMTAINFRCSSELKASLEDLAHLSRSDVSSLLLTMCTKLVEVNKQRIANFRRQAATPIKMPFEENIAPKKKTAKSPTPITNAGDETANAPQDIAPKVDAAIMDGDTNEN